MSLIVHGVPLSPYVRKVCTALNEKELMWEMKTVVPYATPDSYSEINPLRRVPALEDNGHIICDSAVICDYLEHKADTTPLIPGTALSRARCLWLEKYADYELAPVSTFGIFREHLVRPTLSETTDTTAIRNALKALPGHLGYLESELGENQWFVDNHFSLADIAIASQLINLQHTGYSLSSASWHTLHAFVERFRERTSVKELLASEEKVVAKIKERFSIPEQLPV